MTKGLFPKIEGFLILLVLTGFVFSPLPTSEAVTAESNGQPENVPLVADYARMPILFEHNRGQVDRDVRFISRVNGYTLYLTKDGATFALKIASGETPNTDGSSKFERKESMSEVLRMRFAGANENPVLDGSDEAGTRTNYYTGKRRIENVKNYRRVAYKNIYNGIDAVFYGSHSNQLEYDFIVAPNADANVIGLSFDGVRDISINDRGELVLRTESTELVQQKPVAYQEIDGIRKNVAISYKLDVKGQVGFTIGDYDRSAELVIDPALSYLTYIGGTAFDIVRDIAADANGNAYITGETASLNFHGLTRSDNDAEGAYVAKLNATGTAFDYITILEGNGDDDGVGVAVDASGNAYVTGVASRYFPTTAGAYDTVHGIANGDDAFVTKLNPTGEIVYSSFLGGTDSDGGADIAVDSSGKAYVVGNTYSNSAFPKKNQYQGCGIVTPFQSFDSQDAFLTVFNAAGSDITYSSCIGNTVGVIGLSDESAIGVALDASNNAYVTGLTKSNSFKVKNAAQDEIGGGTDAFVAKFIPTQSGDASVAYATFLGGGGTDRGFGIAVTGSGIASVTGITGSFDFPLQNAFDSTNQINEAFVTQYGSTGALLNSTFLGGSDQDEGDNIAVGNGGTIYVTGSTLSNDFPLAVPFQTSRRGVRDVFVTKIRFGINSNPGVSSSSYLGGNGNDKGFGIAVRGNHIFVAGPTESSNLLTTSGVVKATSNASASNSDGFVARILDSRKDTIGTFDPVDTSFDLKNTLAGGVADIIVNRGVAGDVGVAGDFNGDGIDTVSTFNNGVWKISNANVTVSGYPVAPVTVNFGQAGDLPIVGDWNNDGIETPGVYRPSVGQFFLTNSIILNAPVDVTVVFGVGEDLPISGDWNADGFDSVGVFRPSVGQFFLTDDNVLAPNIDQTIFFGTNGDLPTAGDWDGNGVDTVGVWRTSTAEFFLTNDNINISNQFVFGAIGDRPVAGDWDGKPNQ
ncbi:MAG TPA: SBBP repeat-containing protein [Pyrinomonadaceae bacterium]|nr:SBBP repeat-containing protein [Pyrinomonadaceae bacterium]